MRIHPVIHVETVETSLAQVEVVRRHAVSGVFLINHDADDALLGETIEAVAAAHPDLFLGANVIRRDLPEALSVLRDRFADGMPLAALWTDRAALSPTGPPAAYAEAREQCGFAGLHFGGVAFKYQPHVPLADLTRLARDAAGSVDVATASGPGTGRAADRERLEALRAGLGDHRLALASGVTPENVADYVGLVDDVLVATGIAGPSGQVDERRLAALLRNAGAA